MKLYPLVSRSGKKRIAVAGLAKNTGKTTTLNVLIREAENAGETLLLASFGRDGEYRDALTEHRKPAIHIPGGSLFATVEGYAGPVSRRETMAETDIRTPLGPVGLFRAAPGGAEAELVGLNRVSLLSRIAAAAGDSFSLFLIDGALDRKSFAVPELADAVILATGAALGGSESEVAAYTARELEKLTLPGPSHCIPSGTPYPDEGLLWKEGEFQSLPEVKWLNGEIPPVMHKLRYNDAVWLPRALGEPLAQALLDLPAGVSFELVVKDGTRIFISHQSLMRLESRGILLRTDRSLPILAVTINPWTPDGPVLDSRRLQASVKRRIPNIPVLNILS